MIKPKTEHERLCKSAYDILKREEIERSTRVSNTGVPEGRAYGLIERLAEEWEKILQESHT